MKNRIQVFLFVVVGILGMVLSGQQTKIDQAVNRHLLTEYGPCKTVEEAKAALAKAVKELTTKGGGILVIPDDVPENFQIENLSQQNIDDPAVTIIDFRKGFQHTYVPPFGKRLYSGVIGSSFKERYLDKTLNRPYGSYPAEHFYSVCAGGTSSYSQGLLKAVKKGKNQRCYVATMRGLFVGQHLNISSNAGHYGGKENELIIVKSLGLDGNSPYFITDLKYDHPQKALVNSKHVVNGLSITDISHSDTQTAGSLMINKEHYGQGDAFTVQAFLRYQSNVMSANGDEGGGVYEARIWQDLETFLGKVESWNPQKRELVYEARAKFPDHLGTSRPILNMNKKKWITTGKIMVIRPGLPKRFDAPRARYTLIVGNQDTGWDPSLAGRWIAIDEPSECIIPGDPKILNSKGIANRTIRRWWHITEVEKRKDGKWNLYVETVKWNANRCGGPTLFDYQNYSDPKRKVFKELKYIIAPGAWVADTRDGISGKHLGWGHIANPQDKRRLVLAPSTIEGTKFDFEPGDPITQPAGPNPYAPVGFRVRHKNNFPPMPLMGDASFVACNSGSTRVQSALVVHGRDPKKCKTIEEVLEKRKDRMPCFLNALYVQPTTRDSILIQGMVENSAICFDQQRYEDIKPIKWRLRRGQASFHCDPKSADFVFNGGNMNFSGKSTIKSSGLSATEVPARNLRGINVPVKSGNKKRSVKFSNPEADANYSINIQPNWNTNDWVASKTAAGFEVEFSVPAPKNAQIDWQLIR